MVTGARLAHENDLPNNRPPRAISDSTRAGGLAHLEKEAEFCLRSHEVIFGPTLTSSPNELPTGASQGVD